jgi:arginase
MTIALTVYQGRAGDRNELGVSGAMTVGNELAAQLNVPVTVVGTPRPSLNVSWKQELAAAAPELRLLADRVRSVVRAGNFPLTTLNRCAAGIATLPVVADTHPDLVVVWFDAHGDLNTPESSRSGYLGGLVISAAAGLWDSGFGRSVRLGNVILVGSRDLDSFEADLIAEGRVQLINCDDRNRVTKLMEFIAGRPVYVHLDCDVMEPGLVPTEFEVPNGLSFVALKELCQALATQKVVGLEIAEFQSRWTTTGRPGSPTELIAALHPLISAVEPTA